MVGMMNEDAGLKEVFVHCLLTLLSRIKVLFLAFEMAGDPSHFMNGPQHGFGPIQLSPAQPWSVSPGQEPFPRDG